MAVGSAGFATAAVFALLGAPSQAQQQQPRSTMDERLAQLIRSLDSAPTAAIDESMEILYGGLRPLPTKGVPETEEADRRISQMERELAAALDRYATGGANPEERNRALDVKLFIEQMNEVAAALGQVTSQCGEGDRADRPPCDELHQILNEETGEEMFPGSHIPTIQRSYSVKIRRPFVAPWIRQVQEDIHVPVLARGECAVVFKEHKGVMLRLHFQRVTRVLDPWATPALARGLLVPIWYLSWPHAQYVKTYNVCNHDGTRVVTTVTQRVKQDRPLEFFWRYYPKDP